MYSIEASPTRPPAAESEVARFKGASTSTYLSSIYILSMICELPINLPSIFLSPAIFIFYVSIIFFICMLSIICLSISIIYLSIYLSFGRSFSPQGSRELGKGFPKHTGSRAPTSPQPCPLGQSPPPPKIANPASIMQQHREYVLFIKAHVPESDRLSLKPVSMIS